jgi:hypothetical protein
MVPQSLVLIIWAIVSYGLAGACTDLREAPHSRWQMIIQDGVHWLGTPCCERFFPIGVNVMEGGYSQRFPDERIAYHWGTFYPDLEYSGQFARQQLFAWGFNAAGGWSLHPMMLQLPTIPNLELGRTTRFLWFNRFHPTTAEHMGAWGRRWVAPYKGNPNRIDYFTANEIGGGNGALFIYHLKQPATNHTKQRLIVLLHDHYDDWKQFTHDFVARQLSPPLSVYFTVRGSGRSCTLVARAFIWCGSGRESSRDTTIV